MEHKDNLLGVVETVFRWKKIVFLTCAATFVGACIVALLLPVYYKSTTLFYAANPDLSSPELLFGKSTEKPKTYGQEVDRDRILSIANSRELTEFMVDSFHLYEHYDIDPNGRLAAFKVSEKFSDNFEVVKTKYDAIEMSIEDTDKELATNMVNAARDRIAFLGQKLIKESHAKVMATLAGNISEKEKQLVALNDSIQHVRERYGVYNTLAQSENLSDLIAKAESKLNNAQAKVEALQSVNFRRDSINLLRASAKGYENELLKLNERLKTFNQGMAKAEVLKEIQTTASEQLSLDKELYKLYQAAYNSELPIILLLEPGELPIVKSRPKRALIVLAATFVAFVFSVLGVVIFDTYRDVEWKEILHLNKN
jgi:capsule polysaccharide export protein KpsE/RkpR